ncbi:MAG: Rieske 2Fe-2S domain-containing protein [Geminicoccaceae bacterium]
MTEAALRALASCAAEPFERAHAMPPAAYTDPGVLALEQERIFAREWICVGRASTLAEPGAYVTLEVAGQPVAVIRQPDGTIRAFSNVCLHRMSTLLEGSGRTAAIVCPYHAWTYNLDGTLRAAPHMDRSDGFDRTACRLPELRCEHWQGWVYVTLDRDIAPVAERLAPLTEMVAPYHMENYVETFREEHVWDTNWKILAENFMESYHLPMLHRGTIGPYSKIEEMDCPPGLPTFNYHWIIKDATLPIGNAHLDNRHLEGQWRKTTGLFAIYPSHMITLTPGYFWYLVLQPRGVGKVHMLFGGGLAPEFLADPQGPGYMAQLKALLDRVNIEDRTGVEAVFKGLNAPLARAGRLSWLERPNYDFARYLAERLV